MSVVLVVNLPGGLMRFPTAVICVLCGTSFWGLKFTPMFAYVAKWSGGMFVTSVGVITNMAFVPIAPVLSLPWHMPPKSLPKAVCHVSAMTGSFMSFL